MTTQRITIGMRSFDDEFNILLATAVDAVQERDHLREIVEMFCLDAEVLGDVEQNLHRAYAMGFYDGLAMRAKK